MHSVRYLLVFLLCGYALATPRPQQYHQQGQQNEQQQGRRDQQYARQQRPTPRPHPNQPQHLQHEYPQPQHPHPQDPHPELPLHEHPQSQHPHHEYPLPHPKQPQHPQSQHPQSHRPPPPPATHEVHNLEALLRHILAQHAINAQMQHLSNSLEGLKPSASITCNAGVSDSEDGVDIQLRIKGEGETADDYRLLNDLRGSGQLQPSRDDPMLGGPHQHEGRSPYSPPNEPQPNNAYNKKSNKKGKQNTKDNFSTDYKTDKDKYSNVVTYELRDGEPPKLVSPLRYGGHPLRAPPRVLVNQYGTNYFQHNSYPGPPKRAIYVKLASVKPDPYDPLLGSAQPAQSEPKAASAASEETSAAADNEAEPSCEDDPIAMSTSDAGTSYTEPTDDLTDDTTTPLATTSTSTTKLPTKKPKRKRAKTTTSKPITESTVERSVEQPEDGHITKIDKRRKITPRFTAKTTRMQPIPSAPAVAAARATAMTKPPSKGRKMKTKTKPTMSTTTTTTTTTTQRPSNESPFSYKKPKRVQQAANDASFGPSKRYNYYAKPSPTERSFQELQPFLEPIAYESIKSNTMPKERVPPNFFDNLSKPSQRRSAPPEGESRQEKPKRQGAAKWPQPQLQPQPQPQPQQDDDEDKGRHFYAVRSKERKPLSQPPPSAVPLNRKSRVPKTVKIDDIVCPEGQEDEEDDRGADYGSRQDAAFDGRIRDRHFFDRLRPFTHYPKITDCEAEPESATAQNGDYDGSSEHRASQTEVVPAQYRPGNPALYDYNRPST